TGELPSLAEREALRKLEQDRPDVRVVVVMRPEVMDSSAPTGSIVATGSSVAPGSTAATESSDAEKFARVVDEQNLLAQRYDALDGTCYLIRPDQHIAARW